MVIVEQIFIYVAGLGFLALAFRLTHKEKYLYGVVALVLACIAFLSAQTWFQGIIKTEIISRTFSTLEAYGNRLDDFQRTTAKMKAELADHQTQIEKHQVDLQEQQGKIRAAQTALSSHEDDITNQYAQLAALQAQLATVQTNILSQQAQLEDFSYWVNHLFASTTNETIHLNESNHVTTLIITNAVQRVCCKLKHIPIHQSLQITVLPGEGFNLPQSVPDSSSFYVYKNLVFVNLVGYNRDTTTVRFQYVRDLRQTNTIRDVSCLNGQLLTDGVAIWHNTDYSVLGPP